MVAIVSGNSLGVSLTSLNTLGQRGALGAATQGRNGELTYVNVFSGNLVLQDRDDLLVNHGIDITALRTYNSQGKFSDDNGDNWSNGVYKQQLRLSGVLLAAGSSIIRTGRDGSESTYLYDAGRQLYVSTNGGGAYDTIAVDAGHNQLVWTSGSTGRKEAYDGAGTGRLLSSTDSNGNTITYNYGANGLLSSVADAAGEATYYDYSGTNLSQIRTVTADGRTLTRVRYSYDASNRLSVVTVDLTPADNAIADNQVYQTTYTYDGDSKRIASVTQSDGSAQRFTYVQVGADYRIATVQDGLTHTTSYSYDTASGRTTVIDPLGLKTLYDYDSAGQLTRITTPAVAGVAASTSFSYNANGDVIQVVDGEGHAIDMQYDGNGNQILQRDAAGNTVTRTYDGNNQLQTETTYLAPDPDGAGPGQPGTPLTTRYIYDSGNHNRLRFVVSAEGRVTEHRYNSYGERSSSFQYLGASYDVSALGAAQVPPEATLATWAGSQNQAQMSRTDMVYDARGQLQSSSSWSALDASGNGVANGSQIVTQYLYDQSGQLLNTIGGRGGLTQYTYDGLGRVLTSKDAANQLTITSYDDANHKTTVTQANGLSTISAYDQAGRLISVQQSNAGQVLGTTLYSYDADNRLRMTQDPTSVRNFILYDDAGRKTADIDGNGSVTEYVYNKDNQLTQTIAYANTIDVSQLADATGKLTAATLAGIRPGANALDRKSWRAYDSANRLSKTVDGQPGLVTEYRYDGASHLVGTTVYATLVDTTNLGSSPSAVSIAPASAGGDRISRSFYDNDGLLRATLDAEGYLTEQRYDSAGRLSSRVGYATATDASLRASGSLAQLLPAAGSGDIVTWLLLNGKGQVAGEIDGEGYLTEKVYNGNGDLAQTVRYANKVTAAVSNTTTVASVRPASSADDRVTTMDYDALNRIKQQTNAEGTVTQYSYDNAGHLSQTVSAAGSSDVRAIGARYDVQGRLTGELTAEGSALLIGSQTQAQVDAIWAAYGLTHSYDAAGRRTSTTDQNGSKTLFFYDADNRLTQTVNALGEVSEKQYNGLGQLAATVQYGTRISTSGLTGGLASAALASALNAVRNSKLDSNNSFTYNANGTLATSTDALGNITTRSYDAFGELVSSTRVIDATHALTQTSSYDRRGLAVGAGMDGLGVNAVTATQYDAFGRVTRTVDANGNARSQSYDRVGRVVQSFDPLNILRSTTYDAFDRILTQTDGLGNVTRYSYNTAARSTTLITPEGVAVTTVKTRNGQTQSITDGLGNVTRYGYDKNGNLLSTVTPLSSTSSSYDHANRVMQIWDANGNLTSYSYDAANRLLTRQVDPNGLNLTTSYQYDAKGQQIATTDANGVLTQISFNLKGQALSQTLDPTGLKLTTQYSYDGTGNVLTVTSPGGSVTQYVYDNLGRRTEQHVDPSGLNLSTFTSYDKKGNAVTVTDPRRNVMRYVYDADDRLVFTVDALGSVTQNGYDANGRVTQTTKYAAPIGLAGLSAIPLASEVNARLAPSAAADATELRRYDRDGRLAWIVDATGAVTQNSYDANGNVIKRLAYATRLNAADLAALRADASKLPAPLSDGLHDKATQLVYDALGRTIYIVDASGAVTEQHYDGNGNSIERITYVKTISVGQPATLASIAQQLAAIADPARDSHIVNAYDSASRLSYTVNGSGAVSQFVYDNNNNVVRRTDFVTPLTGPLTASINFAAVVPSGANQLINPGFNNVGSDGVPLGWSYGDWRVSADNKGVNLNLDWSVNKNAFGEKTFFMHQPGRDPVNSYQEIYQFVNVGAGKNYSFSAYVGAHRATSEVIIQWYGADGQPISVAPVNASSQDTAQERSGGSTLEGYKRVYATGTAPAGAVRARLILRKDNTDVGQADSWLFATRMQFEEIAAGAATPSTWTPTILSGADDKVIRNVYDAANRQIYSVDAIGAVTQQIYDANGQVVQTIKYAKPISVPGAGGRDGKTLTLSSPVNDSGALFGAAYQPIDTSKSYMVRARVRQVSGEGSFYLGVATKDSAGNPIVNSTGGNFSYAGASSIKITPDMGWQIFEGTVSGEYVASAGVYDPHKFFAGSKSAAPLILYNYYGNSSADANRAIEVDYVQLIDTATGAVLNPNSDMSAGASNWIVGGSSGKLGSTNSTTDTLTATQIQAQLLRNQSTGLNPGAGIGVNQLLNSGFTNIGSDGVPLGWTYGGWRVDADQKGANLNADWSVNKSTFGEKTFYLHQAGRDSTNSYQEIYQFVNVAEGKNYSFSAYVGAHRATTEVIIQWYGADGNPISVAPVNANSQDALQERTGGSSLDGYKRVFAIGAAPAGAVRARLILRKDNTDAGQADSWLFATRAQFEEVAATAAAPSDWKPTILLGADDRVTSNVYDAAGRLKQQTKAAGTAAAGTVAYGYDAMGNIASITNERGFVTTQEFDALGRKTSTSVPLNDGLQDQTAPQYAVTKTQYDAFGNAVKVTDPRGNVGYFYYDQNNRVVLQIDPLGYATQTSYTVSGKPNLVVRYATAVAGPLSTSVMPALVASAADAPTKLEYDQNDRLVKSTDAENVSEYFGYDGAGNRISYQNKVGGIATSTYDGRGLLLSETLPVMSRNSVGVLVPVIKRYSYDVRGNRIQMIEAAGLPEQRTTNYVYDVNDRLITQSGDAITIRNEKGWSTGNPTQHWTYDAVGNKTSYTDANGNQTHWYYDTANRKVAELSAAGTLSQWTYDAASNMTGARIYGDAVAAPAGDARPTAVNGANYRETLYSYDRGNRQTQTLIDGATFAQRPAGGTDVNIFTGQIKTSQQYDALGNVIYQTDGRGNQTLFFYNAIGKKIAQVDAENYLTVWVRDQNDSVTMEYRYANRLSKIATAASDVNQLMQDAGINGSDRITTSSYDHLNRLLTQSHLNLMTSSVDGSGAITTVASAATTHFEYDGLNNVTRKTEANGEVSDWTFDAIGRQTRSQSAGFIDFQGALVRPTTDTSYDGLNNVVQSIARGKISADDRVTTFLYDAAGHLKGKSTLNVDGWYEYNTDAVGNITEMHVISKNSDGGKRFDATVIHYDAANREIFRQMTSAANGDPSTNIWNGSDTHEVRYNAYGEIVGKGVNGSTAEFAEYDSQGRLWKTNAGDGATKAYLYDASGNATVLLQSAGADMRNMTLAQILAISQAQGASPDPVVQAAIAAGGIHMTVSVFDHRNQLTDTYQPTMQSAHNMGTIQQFLTQQAGGNFTGGGVTVGPTKATTTLNTAVSPYQGSVAINKPDGVSFSFHSTRTVFLSMPGRNRVNQDSRSASVWIPTGTRFGGGDLHFYFNGVDYAQAAWNATKIDIPPTNRSWPVGTYPVAVYQDVPGGGRKVIAQSTVTIPEYESMPYGEPTDIYVSSVPVTTKPLIQFQNQPASTNRLIVMVRPIGSTGSWIWSAATPMTNDAGGAMPGWFSQDWSGTGESGPFEIQYVALDAGGNVLNIEKGSMMLSGGNPYITQSPQPIVGAGQAIGLQDVWYNPDGALHIIGQGTAAQSARIRYRHAGTGEAWAQQMLSPAGIGPGSPATPGWFAMRTAGWTGNYEYFIETYTGANGSGTMINRASGTFTPAGAVSPLQSWTDLPENVAFNNQPASSAKMSLTYTVQGGSPVTIELNSWDAVHQQFNWDASTLVPDRLNNYLVDYHYQTMDANGTVINAARGTLRLGTDPAMLSHLNDIMPANIAFNPPAPNATRLVLQYRNAGSKGAYNTVPLSRDGSGQFRWNVEKLRPGAGTLSLEYAYDLYDANGQPVAPPGGNPRAQGVLDINSDSTAVNRQLQWTVTGLNNTAPDVPNTQAAIHRIQGYSAFGDIVSETDGRRNQVTLAYDAMGRLISKQAPLTDVTLENGNIIRATPTTQYYYDASGHVVGVRDANGNLNAQTQLAGFGGADAGSARTVAEFHAGGGSKSNAYDIFGDLRTSTDELQRVTSNTYDQGGRLIQVIHPARLPGTPGNAGTAAVSAIDSYTYDTLGNRISHTNNTLSQRETTDYDADGRVIRTRSFGGQEITYTYSYDKSILGTGGLPVGGWLKVTSYTGSRSSSDKTDYFQHITSHQDFGGHVVTYSYDYAAHLKSQTSTAGQSVDFSYYANGYVKSTTDNVLNVLSYFEYDEEGNRTRESYTTTGPAASRIIYQLADIKYDELNRVIDYRDPQAHIQYQYDANGNRRRVLSNYNNGIDGAAATQDFWYKYDSQNRFVLTMGQLSNGIIGIGATGVQIGYDVAGQRRSAAYADGHSESYTYSDDGYLEDVSINGVLRSRRANDTLGRVANYYEYATDGRTVTYSKNSIFDGDNRVTKDTVVNSPVGSTASTTITNYDYRLNDGNGHYTGADQGVVTHTYQYDPSKTAGSGIDTVTSYVWWDEAKQSKIQVRGTDPDNPNAWRWNTGLSDFQYDVNGHLQQVSAHEGDNKGNPVANVAPSHTLKYTSDQYGQVMRRDDIAYGGGLRVAQRYYYLNGQLIGDVSNNGPSNISYAEDLAQRGTQNFGRFRYGKPIASADFDQNYQPINSSYPGMAAGSYTAKEGDTLSSIARAMWGDSTLWYLIAEANGLTNGDKLIAGQVLSIPNKVSNFHNTSSTFRVYNPGQAIGDTLPTLPAEPLPPPPPSADGGCGGFVQILAIVVAIVVTFYTAGAASAAWGPVVGGAVGGAAGAAASQAVLIAGGQQNGFNWTGIAMGAIGGAVAGGVMEYGPAMQGSSAFTQGAVRGAITSVVSQGVEVATGLQSHFDWRGVAATAIASGVSAGVSDSIGRSQYGDDEWAKINQGSQAARSARFSDDLGQTLARGIGAGLAGGVASALVRGGSLQNKLPGILQDAVTSTIGNAIADQVMASKTRQTFSQSVAERQASIYSSDASPNSSLGKSNIDWGMDSVGKFGYASPPQTFGEDVAQRTAEQYMPRVVITGRRWTEDDKLVFDLANKMALSSQNTSSAGNAGPTIFDSVGGTVLGAKHFIQNGIRFVNDQGLVAGNALSGGWLARNDEETRAAIARNTDLGQKIIDLPGNASRFALRAMVGNVTLDEIGQGANQALRLDQIRALEARGDYMGAQAIRSENALNVASLVLGGAPLARDLVVLGGSVGKTSLMGVQLVAEDFAGSRMGQQLYEKIEQYNLKTGMVNYVVPPVGENSGPVVFRAPPGATAEEIAQVRAYVDGSNEALQAGQLSPTGRVSTGGELRTDASLAAAQERARAAADGVPYEGHAGHVPDTTWTGNPQPYSWLDLAPRVNSSLGGQAPKYPVGYKPTEFIFEEPK
ncbi:LysM peptidoglycan-binding domain-containing protein [Collimonas humicola]|uniref:LysM peptidoglycan-binding domain-containing protein n=1 Tax=Collimonas humicola TaxID=2825886 RepID=UPI001B8B141E|nr:LysM peptidoglycan-binding domain-containing protein [Collimonas humicola]